MRKIFTTLFFITIFGFSKMVNAFDKTYVLTVDEFESLQINQGGITINNFALGEKKSFMSKGLSNVNVSFSVRNKNSKPNVLNLMMVGMSDNEVIWALDAAPLMSIISENTTDKAESNSYISPGDVKKTKKIWMRVVGDF